MYKKGYLDISVPVWKESTYCPCGHTKDAHTPNCQGNTWAGDKCRASCVQFQQQEGYWTHGIASDAPRDVNIAYLPHSCDEWVIGNKEAVEVLIADLQEILEKL